jgi:hypothetical protein
MCFILGSSSHASRLAAQHSKNREFRKLPIIEMRGFDSLPRLLQRATKVYLSLAAAWPLDTQQPSLGAENGLPFDTRVVLLLATAVGLIFCLDVMSL